MSVRDTMLEAIEMLEGDSEVFFSVIVTGEKDENDNVSINIMGSPHLERRYVQNALKEAHRAVKADRSAKETPAKPKDGLERVAWEAIHGNKNGREN